MSVRVYKQMNPFYETMMLISHSDDFAVSKKVTIDALNELGLDGEVLYRAQMPIYERYVNAFCAHRHDEPDNAFWMEIEGDELSLLLFQLLWSFKDSTSNKKTAEDIFTVLADIFAESDIGIDYTMMRTGRADVLMAAIDQADICSKDKWILLQILLCPEDSVHSMLCWIEQNIDAYYKAFKAVESDYNELLDRYVSFIENKDNHFRGIISGLESISAIYPSLASPLSQLVFNETAFCGMLTYLLDYSESEKDEVIDFLRIGWKALADKSKLEILRLLKARPMYNQEIAETLGLTAATVSYHMNALLACHFVTISKSDGRVYYDLKRQSLILLMDQTRDLLIE